MNSMTGFGRAAANIQTFSARVEISGVNRKQAEIAFGIPRNCSDWEQQIRPLILERVSRGRVYVSISFEPAGGGDSANEVSLDKGKLQSFINSVNMAETMSGKALPLSASDLLRLDIIHHASSADIETPETWPLIEPAVKEALERFLAMRATEGENLKRVLLEKLEILKNFKQQIAGLAPEVPVKLKESMLQRLQESGLPVDMDDERIIREIALFADRCDISEELSRLDSHFDQFSAICSSDEPAGRPLDFLCQEIFREFNTIGSKANDAAMAHLVVSGKTELEKIREQVQNIE